MKLTDILQGISTSIKELLEDNRPIKPVDFGEKFFSIALQNFAESMVDSIGGGLTNINAITMADNITAISANAFSGMSSIKELDLNNVTSIKSSAFNKCGIVNLFIPASVSSIANNAFSGVPATTITVDEDNTVYSSPNSCNAIVETSSKTLVFGNKSTKIPESSDIVTSIGSYAFYSGNLVNINIPSNINSIGSSAFQANYSVNNVTINEGLETIGASAFAQLSSLLQIKFPSTLKAIGAGAFGYNSKVHTYDFSELDTPPTLLNISAFDGVHPAGGWTILVKSGTKNLWLDADNWKALPEGVIKEVGEE